MLTNTNKNSMSVLIAAGETEDEVGTIIRVHLLVESTLNRFLEQKRTGELAQFVKEPRDYTAKLSLSAAFGLPIEFVASAYRINVIRNKLAHRLDSPIDPGDLKQLEISVNRIAQVDPSFRSLQGRYVELSQKYPGKKFAYGHDQRISLLIASVVFYGAMLGWLESQYPGSGQA